MSSSPSKTLLVAQREYVENLRTKTFWIGILSLPVILVLAVLVPTWLEDVKDVRRYAVIDQSDWLWGAMQERATFASAERLFTFLQEQAQEGEATLARMPTSLRQLAEMVRDMPPEQIEAYARMSAAMGKSMIDQVGADFTGELTEEQKEEAKKSLEWMVSLSPDEARQLGAGIKAEDYEQVEIPEGEADPEAWLREQLSADPPQLFAYFIICEDPVSSSAECRYVSNNRTDPNLKNWVSSLATDEVQARRMRDAKIAPALMRKITERVNFSEKLVTAEGEEKAVEAQDTVRQWAPVAFVYLLWIAVITIAQMLLTNTVEEKSNRIIEVLLSSVSPLQLMGGKILGIAATGLTVVVSWVLSFLIVLKFLPQMIGASDLPVDLSVLVSDPIFLVSFVVYFLMGYLLYAAILVGFGSVTNSLKEAQNLMQPVFVILIVPILAMVPIGQDPNGPLARWLSYFPPFTPFVMMNRAAGPPPLWEYVATSVLLVVSIFAAFWVAAKVFRIGILMTGKPPRLLEILHWIRTPVGVVPDTRVAAEAVAEAEDGRAFEDAAGD